MAKTKPFVIYCTLALCLLATGCATPTIEAVSDNFTKSLEKRDFHRASQQLRRLERRMGADNVSQYSVQFAQARRNFEANCRQQADAMVANDQWQSALNKLKSCIDRLPNETPLIDDHIMMKTERDKRLRLVQRNIDIIRAEHWALKEPLEYKIQALSNPDMTEWWHDYQKDSERQRLTNSMIDCADEAIATDQLKLANRCVKAAKNLDESYQNPALKQALSQQKKQLNVETVQQQKAINQKQIVQKKQQEREERQEQREELAALKVEYRQLIKSDQLASAIATMNKMKALSPENKQVNIWANDLDVIIGIKVKHDLERGQALYSQGLIQQALFLWQPLSVLDPENLEVRENIQRAEKFIENLDKLESESAPVLTPGQNADDA